MAMAWCQDVIHKTCQPKLFYCGCQTDPLRWEIYWNFLCRALLWAELLLLYWIIFSAVIQHMVENLLLRHLSSSLCVHNLKAPMISWMAEEQGLCVCPLRNFPTNNEMFLNFPAGLSFICFRSHMPYRYNGGETGHFPFAHFTWNTLKHLSM